MEQDEINKARLVLALKRELDVWECDDEQVLAATKGTFFRARVEVRLAVGDLCRVLRNELQNILIAIGKWFRQ
jgi:hypothetical protein